MKKKMIHHRFLETTFILKKISEGKKNQRKVNRLNNNFILQQVSFNDSHTFSKANNLYNTVDYFHKKIKFFLNFIFSL